MSKECAVPAGEIIAKGDAVCVTGFDIANNRPIVKRATRDNLATSKTVFGVAENVPSAEDVPPGLSVSVLVAGDVANDTVTLLGVGRSRIVATDLHPVNDKDNVEKQCRLIRIDRPDGSEFVVGTSDENGNLVVQPRASRDKSDLYVYNVRSYGAVPDDPTADVTNLKAFQDALDAMRANPNTIAKLVADGTFYLSDTLEIKQSIIFEGTGQNDQDNGGIGSRSSPGTMLVFTNKKVAGIRIRGGSGLDNPTKTYDNPFPPSAERTVLRNLTVYSKDDIPDDAPKCRDEEDGCIVEENCIHGVYASTIVCLENVTVQNFTHDGIHIVGGECRKPLFNKRGKDVVDCDPILDVDCKPVLDGFGKQVQKYDGNADGSYLENCTVGGCGRDGFHFRGGDASTCVISCCSAVVNRRYGFFDGTRLNTYLGCHAEGNGAPGLKPPIGGGTGSEYHTEHEANSSTFISCYAEGNRNLSEFKGQVNIIGGAIGQSYITADSTAFSLLNGVAARAPFVYQNDKQDGKNGELVTRIELGQNDVNVGALNFSLPTFPDFNLLRYAHKKGWWGLLNVDVTSLWFPTTVSRPRRRVPAFSQGIFYGSPSDLEDVGASKMLTNHTAMLAIPSTETWEKGDVVWNTSPMISKAIGWVCTSAGTNGKLVGVSGTVDMVDPRKVVVNAVPDNLVQWTYITIAADNRLFQIVNDPSHSVPANMLVLDSAATLGAGGAIAFHPAAFSTFGLVDGPSKVYAVDTLLTLADRYVTVTATGMTMTLPAKALVPNVEDGQTHSIKSQKGVTTKVNSADGIAIDGSLTAMVMPLENRDFRYSAAMGEWEIR